MKVDFPIPGSPSTIMWTRSFLERVMKLLGEVAPIIKKDLGSAPIFFA
ncbi:MAG: hypothetical protein QXG08_01080 [Candidatus Methanomethyliaceae archaeon]